MFILSIWAPIPGPSRRPRGAPEIVFAGPRENLPMGRALAVSAGASFDAVRDP